MSFFKVSTDEEAIKDSTGGNYISTSGIYDIIINQLIVATSKNGSTYLNMWLKYEDQDQMLYNAIRITDNDGQPCFQSSLLNKLATICDSVNGNEIGDPTPMTLPVGKGGADEECMVLSEFENMPVSVRISFEYYIYDNKIQERKTIRNFFRVTDHATAAEIVNRTEIGKQYATELEKANLVIYKDDLTEEEVKEWKLNRKNNSTEKKDNKVSLGQKRHFGAKS